MTGTANEELGTSCEQIFDQFISAVTCKSILTSFNQLLDVTELRHADHRHFYATLKTKLKGSWKAQNLWAKLDKRASHRDYKKQQACANMKVLVIGSGPCGLRTAIECALLGAKTVLVEKRDRFSRNNVLHLWPFLITDLRNLGAKKFFGKFCAGAIDHISIRQLQCILLKMALLLGVEVHVNVTFQHLVEPPIDQSSGWHCKVLPDNHPVSEYEFNVLIAADGKRNTLPGFRRKEFRGKLAIAVTANFINRNTQAEARVEEISGVAFIFNQKFFLDLKEKTRIDLENIVYYKDDTHYFVMTAKKASLLEKGVLKEDFADTVALLDRSNVNQDALMAFAREAADFSTNYQLPSLEYAVNHYGQADVAMFDFTSMFAAENASRFVYKNGHHLLMGLVGDTLLEPFWPTGSGCARGFLGAFDAAWMIRSWALGCSPLKVLSERESIFTVLSQTTPSYLHKNHNAYSIDPNTRYPNLNVRAIKPNQVKHLYEGGVFDEKELEEEDISAVAAANKVPNADLTIDSYTLLRWCQRVLNTGKYRDVHIVDFTSSWRSGLALCALIHSFRPELIQNTLLMECEVAANNHLAFTTAEKELGITPVMTGEDMAKHEAPDKLTMISYLSQFYELFKNEPLPSTIPLPAKAKRKSLPMETLVPKPSQSPKRHLSILQKLKSRSKKRKEQEETSDELTFGSKKKKDRQEKIDVELTQYNKLPMSEIANRLQLNRKAEDVRLKVNKNEERSGAVSVTAMADLLVSKFKSIEGNQQPELIRKLKGQPTLLAAKPESEFCSFCHKRVYLMERMSTEGEFFHRNCFKCDHCGVSLRLNHYSCDRDTKPVKFYCFRHTLPELRIKSQRKSLEEKTSKKLPELITSSALSVDILNAFNDNITDSSELSPHLLAKDVTENKNMQERVEFEISFDGCEEESEEEQFEHNLRASLSNPLSDGDDDSDSDSYSDLDSDDELWESALDSLKSPTLSSDLQRSWEAYQSESILHTENQSLEYVSFTNDNDKENNESSTEVEQDSDSEESSEDKQQEDTYDSSKEEVSQQTLLSPVSKISLSKANFFSEPPTVVSLDPWSMFGMVTKEPAHKEEEEKTKGSESVPPPDIQESFSDADSLDELNGDVYLDNMPEEAIESHSDTLGQSKAWQSESENDGDDENVTDDKNQNKVSKHLAHEQLASSDSAEDLQFVEGRLSPSARKAKKFRMKRQTKQPKKLIYSASTDSEHGRNETSDSSSPDVALEQTHNVDEKQTDNTGGITLDMVPKLSDTSDIDDLIITNIDDRFVTSRQKKTKANLQPRTKKKIVKKKSKNVNPLKNKEESLTPTSQITESKIELDKMKFADVTKTSVLALVESFSDSDTSPIDKTGGVSECNPPSPKENTSTLKPLLDNYNDSSTSDIFFSPASTFDESPFTPSVAIDTKKMDCSDQKSMQKSDSSSSYPKTETEHSDKNSKSHSYSSPLDSDSHNKTDSDVSDQKTDSHSSVSQSISSEGFLGIKSKSKAPELTAVQVTPKSDKSHANKANHDTVSDPSLNTKSLPPPQNANSPGKTKVTVDKSRLHLGSSSDLAESDLEHGNKRKISADGIFIKTTADDIPFADDDSESEEQFYTPQPLNKVSFSAPATDVADRQKTKVPVDSSFNDTHHQNVSSKNTLQNRVFPYHSPLTGCSEKTAHAMTKGKPAIENKLTDAAVIDAPKKETKKELAICSLFHSEASRRKEPGSSHPRRPLPVTYKANCDELSDELSDESHVSFKPMQKKTEDLDARVARRLSKMHAKQHKRAEQRRLRMAQEIQRQLEEVEVRQRELEERGIAVEKMLRGDGSDDDEDMDDAQLMSEWFSLVHEKNALLRYESELNVRAKELELEDRQARLESDYRERSKKSEKTESDIAAEGELLNELVEVVEQRNTLVAMLEEDRLREQKEDYDLKKIMAQKGYLLSPLSCDVRRDHEKEILHI
ncbi:protein-methionine sulfoxide oxidase MICAL2-like isoform X1 [Biomphalaria pfeifferi]|uniref:F-actin monooxygenase n=1 Tax=Biomphalaria pfeifferi TaxID=112525 RepID=A0AAD8BF90_BIOPF|nr:protein-methionine sulfoxide oxidase MICAL2-like isoform X1 [Biomphalaria pfeifferi]